MRIDERITEPPGLVEPAKQPAGLVTELVN